MGFMLIYGAGITDTSVISAVENLHYLIVARADGILKLLGGVDQFVFL